MIIEELENKLLKNGWYGDRIHDITIWRNGCAYFLLKNKKAVNPVLFFQDQYNYLKNIKNLSFTVNRLMISWNDNSEWFLKY